MARYLGRVQWLCFARLNSTSMKPMARDPVTIIPTVYELTQDKDVTPETNPETSLVSYLQSRHLIESLTDDKLFDITKRKNNHKFRLYCGADPTAQSLHLGNLLPLMVLLHFKMCGNDVFGLVGGATGQVGDPSGRSSERTNLNISDVVSNVSRIESQITTFLSNGIEYAKSRQFPMNENNIGTTFSVNNEAWWKDIKMLNFLATYGKHIRVNAMLARDSISSRLESGGGIGFNEFTYQILQAYDFYHLHKTENVDIQVGGNDQWGNITAGIDIISRLKKQEDDNNSREAYGITVPLLTTPSGDKFGKSAGNAIFIDAQLTSAYQMYQYFINVSDDMVEKLLKVFTLLPLNVIEGELMPRHLADSGLRIAQRVLAREVVDLIHGVGVGDEMAYITGFLFPTPDQPFSDDIDADKMIENFKRSGILYKFPLARCNDIKMSTLIAEITGKSRREVKTLIRSGGVYLGLDRNQFEDPDDVVLFDKTHHLIDEKLMLMRIGKQQYYVVEFV
ncbi:MSY1 [Candida oxycetoniae]|uniref:Tyrosine--tRNA ligase n=1 Tax=Candida oxycetoniae TaxID=497107 RepID=A0AAI9WYT6_9ASCO|nr:MSY1 [Candida oxycetoniae]KAI3405184.2 MSY1 [Candida oxycetoniae]